MDDLLGNKFLMVSAFTKALSRVSGNDVSFNHDEMHADISRAVMNFYSQAGMDRRPVAIGSDYGLHLWDLTGGRTGWADMTYMFCNGFMTMAADLKKPQRAFVTTPDVQFETVAMLAASGCELSFLNNDWLFQFEEFVLPLAEFPDITYTTYDFSELMDLTEPCFDFVAMSATHAVTSNDLLTKTLDLLEPNGVMGLSMTNETMRLYSEEYHLQPVYDVHQILEARGDITYYHMPHGPGYQYIIKNS